MLCPEPFSAPRSLAPACLGRLDRTSLARPCLPRKAPPKFARSPLPASDGSGPPGLALCLLQQARPRTAGRGGLFLLIAGDGIATARAQLPESGPGRATARRSLAQSVGMNLLTFNCIINIIFGFMGMGELHLMPTCTCKPPGYQKLGFKGAWAFLIWPGPRRSAWV